jgi:hypothetical protein
MVMAVIGLAGYLAWAQSVPQPVLSVTPTGTNQFLITITNAVGSAAYDIYKTPMLNDPGYPWSLSVTGSLGQSNFTVSAGLEPNVFFRAIVGSDWDGDSVPNWMDANANDPTVGALTVTINSPTNGAVVQ